MASFAGRQDVVLVGEEDQAPAAGPAGGDEVLGVAEAPVAGDDLDPEGDPPGEGVEQPDRAVLGRVVAHDSSSGGRVWPARLSSISGRKRSPLYVAIATDTTGRPVSVDRNDAMSQT